MNVTIFVGDIAAAPAEALCTSTNPRLSLMMGTGAAIRARGGYEILRQCEAIIAASGRTTMPAGSVHVTTAGSLPAKRIIHCVASDNAHHSSDETVRLCVSNALAAAGAEGCATVAMPVFATGHARIRFDRAISVMATAIAAAKTNVQRVYVVLSDNENLDVARRAFPGADVEYADAGEDERVSLWDMDT